MADQLKGKVALITGGGSGIGRATAMLFAREGAKVLVADYNADGGERVARAIKEAGGEAIFHAADVSNPKDVEAMVAKTVATFGRLDCAFNNAGIEGEFSPTSECTLENWQRVIAINLSGVFYCMKYEIPEMLKTGGGTIVNTSSICGLAGIANTSAYTAAKHGVAGLTKTAALEFSSKGIRVNAVCPGFIRTPMVARVMDRGSFDEKAVIQTHPINRLGQPEEIAATVLWLSSDASSFVSGVPMPVDGAYMAQ
ncbi:MAG TPA: glucose 1-dehydrogenase [Candidatus Binataceae bacterium]|nr:glucose 1-dehydrogenase [Candidatus Binataceae bacterium]